MYLLMVGLTATLVGQLTGLVILLQRGGISRSEDGGKTWRELTLSDQLNSYWDSLPGVLPLSLLVAFGAAVLADVLAHFFVRDRTQAWGVALAFAVGWMPGLLLAMVTWGTVGVETFWAAWIAAMLCRVIPTLWGKLLGLLIAIPIGWLGANLLWLR